MGGPEWWSKFRAKLKSSTSKAPADASEAPSVQPEPEPTTTISEPNDGGALPTHASHRTAATSTPVAALDSAAASGTVIGLLSESRESAEVNSVAHLAYDRLQDALISAAPSEPVSMASTAYSAGGGALLFGNSSSLAAPLGLLPRMAAPASGQSAYLMDTAMPGGGTGPGTGGYTAGSGNTPGLPASYQHLPPNHALVLARQGSIDPSNFDAASQGLPDHAPPAGTSAPMPQLPAAAQQLPAAPAQPQHPPAAPAPAHPPAAGQQQQAQQQQQHMPLPGTSTPPQQHPSHATAPGSTAGEAPQQQAARAGAGTGEATAVTAAALQHAANGNGAAAGEGRPAANGGVAAAAAVSGAPARALEGGGAEAAAAAADRSDAGAQVQTSTGSHPRLTAAALGTHSTLSESVGRQHRSHRKMHFIKNWLQDAEAEAAHDPSGAVPPPLDPLPAAAAAAASATAAAATPPSAPTPAGTAATSTAALTPVSTAAATPGAASVAAPVTPDAPTTSAAGGGLAPASASTTTAVATSAAANQPSSPPSAQSPLRTLATQLQHQQQQQQGASPDAAPTTAELAAAGAAAAAAALPQQDPHAKPVAPTLPVGAQQPEAGGASAPRQPMSTPAAPHASAAPHQGPPSDPAQGAAGKPPPAATAAAATASPSLVATAASAAAALAEAQRQQQREAERRRLQQVLLHQQQQQQQVQQQPQPQQPALLTATSSVATTASRTPHLTSAPPSDNLDRTGSHLAAAAAAAAAAGAVAAGPAAAGQAAGGAADGGDEGAAAAAATAAAGGGRWQSRPESEQLDNYLASSVTTMTVTSQVSQVEGPEIPKRVAIPSACSAVIASPSSRPADGSAPPAPALRLPSAASHESTKTIAVAGHCPEDIAAQQWSVDDFTLLCKLYEGALSVICHAQHKKSGRQVALKIYKRSRLHEMERFQLAREICLHIRILHPHILSLYAAWKDSKYVYLVLEWAPHGNLFELLVSRGGRLPEAEAARHIIRPLLTSLAFLHSHSWLHRDIKLENVLLDAQGVVKLCDFGLAIDQKFEQANTRLGTFGYFAPEVLDCPLKKGPFDFKGEPGVPSYGCKVDVWSMGVMSYELLTGKAPFAASSAAKIIDAIRTRELTYPKTLSQGARDFLAAALVRDPEQRASAEQLLQHPWILACCGGAAGGGSMSNPGASGTGVTVGLTGGAGI